MFFCSLMPRPTETMISACERSTACLASLKELPGWVRITPSAISTLHSLNRGSGAAVLHLVSAISAPLWKLANHGAVAGEAHIGGELALEHLPREQQLAALVLVADRSR